MGDFKKTLKKRIGFISIYNSIVLLLLLKGIFHIATKSNTIHIANFNLGICIGIQLILLYYLAQYKKALKDEDSLKKLYILENDERSKYIAEKIGEKSINITILGLGLATMISGYFNDTIFFTLLATLVFSALVKVFFKIYYNKIL